MSSARTHCPKCSAPLSSASSIGDCPGCLLQLAMSGTGLERPGVQRKPVPEPHEVEQLVEGVEVVQLLGVGGMGAVYLAKQPKLDRMVAIKILTSDRSGDPVFQERFLREARTLALLNHPHIVSLYEVGRAGASWYILMEYVDGVNLRSLIEDGRLSPGEALRLIPQICDAMQFAHDRGVVHRDIKPENVLVDQNGQIKIADFGLAKLMGDEFDDCITLTDFGQRMGTVGYMAPEQTLHTGDVDHRADIYSLGIIFYEMLTGKRPALNYTPPSRLVDVGVRVDRVIARCLRESLGERFQRASEVKQALEQAAAPKRLPVGVYGLLFVSVLLVTFGIIYATTVYKKTGNGATTKTATANGKSPPEDLKTRVLVMPFSELVARDYQAQWARERNLPLEITSDLGMTFHLIPPGKVEMTVGYIARITQPYYMSDIEVTVGAFRQFVKETMYRTEAEATGMGGWLHLAANSSQIENRPEYVWNHLAFASDDALPVTLVTIKDIEAFTQWLSKRDGKHYRLPSIAEWKWAAFAGNPENVQFSDAETASHWGWHGGNSGNRAHVVRSKEPNPWGIYDAFGNAGEFTLDGCLEKKLMGTFDNPRVPVVNERFTGVGGSFADPFNETSHSLNGRMPFHSVGFRLLLEMPITSVQAP